MEAPDAKTVATVIVSLALAYGELHGDQKADTNRSQLTMGVIEYVASETKPLQARIDDLTAEVAELRKELARKR